MSKFHTQRARAYFHLYKNNVVTSLMVFAVRRSLLAHIYERATYWINKYKRPCDRPLNVPTLSTRYMVVLYKIECRLRSLGFSYRVEYNFHCYNFYYYFYYYDWIESTAYIYVRSLVAAHSHIEPTKYASTRADVRVCIAVLPYALCVIYTNFYCRRSLLVP